MYSFNLCLLANNINLCEAQHIALQNMFVIINAIKMFLDLL